MSKYISHVIYDVILLRDMLGPKPVFRPKIPSTTSETSDLDIGALPLVLFFLS